MSLADATRLKRVLASVFTRKGGNGHWARLVDDLAASQRAKLLSVAVLAPGELPVIGGYERPESWFLITTRRVAWRQGADRHDIPIEDIQEATMDFDDLRSRNLTKLDADRLQLVTSGGTYLIELEPGAPLSGVWNVLNHLGSRNARAHRP